MQQYVLKMLLRQQRANLGNVRHALAGLSEQLAKVPTCVLKEDKYVQYITREFTKSAVSYLEGGDRIAISYRALPFILVSTNRLKADYHLRIMDGFRVNLNVAFGKQPIGKKAN